MVALLDKASDRQKATLFAHKNYSVDGDYPSLPYLFLRESEEGRMTPEEFINEYLGNKFLYHFTDTRNVPSIRQLGLLSARESVARGIQIAASGGNQWSQDADRRSGMDAYVHLSFINDHPMEYLAKQSGQIQQSIYLQISPQILYSEGVLFSPGVANKSGVKPLSLREACEVMDFEVLFKRTEWKNPIIQERRKQAKKYELLVPKEVPLNLILGI